MAEKWVPCVSKGVFSAPGKTRPGFRKDMFGFIDIIALYPECIAAIQACGGDFKGHIDKIKAVEEANEWLRSGHGHSRIEVWYWAKRKRQRGGRAFWSARVEQITEEAWNETNT
jgi:hypothetical protein